MLPIKSRKALETGLSALAARDARLAALWARAGTPGLRRRRSGFPGLLRAIVGQQLSFAAAAAIWGRLIDTIGEPTPEAFAAVSDRRLRALGFSRQKIGFGRALSEACLGGHLRFGHIGQLEDEAAIERLSAVKGIGRWTAECYLLFAHGRPDIWPAQDLALAAAYQRLHALPERPKPSALAAVAAEWAPWRSVAARLLWHGHGKAAL